MGAVRNSNTRASHASVEMRDIGKLGGASSSGSGGNIVAGPINYNSSSGKAAGDPDSPRTLAADLSDRRPSFSYLRRASDRRRRRRLFSGQNGQLMDEFGETGSNAASMRGRHYYGHRASNGNNSLGGMSNSNMKQQQHRHQNQQHQASSSLNQATTSNGNGYEWPLESGPMDNGDEMHLNHDANKGSSGSERDNHNNNANNNRMARQYEDEMGSDPNTNQQREHSDDDDDHNNQNVRNHHRQVNDDDNLEEGNVGVDDADNDDEDDDEYWDEEANSEQQDETIAMMQQSHQAHNLQHANQRPANMTRRSMTGEEDLMYENDQRERSLDDQEDLGYLEGNERRQSMNDRFSEAVSDAMEFVRDESFRKHKRRSTFLRRRPAHMLTAMHQQQQMAIASSAAAAAAAANATANANIMQHKPVNSNFEQDLMGTGNSIEIDSEGGALDAGGAAYRRRRNMRRSPKRRQTQSMQLHDDVVARASNVAMLNQQARMSSFNESDTGSCTSISMMQPIQPQMIVGRHHQRAPPIVHQRQAPFPLINPLQNPYNQQQQQQSNESNIIVDDEHHVPVIDVGRSPSPPMPGTVEAELAAARRRRSELAALGSHRLIETGMENDDLTGPGGGIHLIDPQDNNNNNNNQTSSIRDDDLNAIQQANNYLINQQTTHKQTDSPVRFIAPKIAPLESPSEMAQNQRRLPQIPGATMFKSAADFIQASIYGPMNVSSSSVAGVAATTTATAIRQQHPSLMGVATAAAAAAKSAQSAASHQDDSRLVEFPLVSESPSHLSSMQIPLQMPIGGGHVNQQRAMSVVGDIHSSQTSGIVKGRQGNLRGSLTRGSTVIGPETNIASSSGIQFPRVSGSPTPLGPQQQQQQQQVNSGAELIATSSGNRSTLIAHQDGTQSTLPGTSTRNWASLNRRPNCDEDPNQDWF